MALTEINLSETYRDLAGWTLVGIISLSVLGNGLVFLIKVISEISTKIKEFFQKRKLNLTRRAKLYMNDTPLKNDIKVELDDTEKGVRVVKRKVKK